MSDYFKYPLMDNLFNEENNKDVFHMILPDVKASEVKVVVEKGVLKVDILSESPFIISPAYGEVKLKSYHDAEKAKAYMQRGILTITVPYKEGTVFNVNVEG